MLRLRRYRTFLIFAIFTTFILYHFRSVQRTTYSPLRQGHPNQQGNIAKPPPRETARETRPYIAITPVAADTPGQVPPSGTPPISKPMQSISQPTQPPLDEAPPISKPT